MNKTVEVTGMEIKTKVGANLLICYDNVEAHYSSDTLSEGRKALLEPVSSNTGKTNTFYYTTDAAAGGQKLHADSLATNPYKKYAEGTAKVNGYAGKNYYDAGFNGTYSITVADDATAENPAYGYLDYVFYLKATTDDTDQQIRMTKCNLVYNDSTDIGTAVGNTGEQAWRVAVFATELTGANGGAGLTEAVTQIDPANVEGEAAKSILRLNGAENFLGDSKTNAVSGPTSLAATTYDTAAVLHTFTNAAETGYYKVTVRVWLEGEDTTCKSSTYATMDNAWKLDLEFKLSNGAAGTDDAVTNIGSDNAVGLSNSVLQTAPTTPIDPTIPAVTTAAANNNNNGG